MPAGEPPPPASIWLYCTGALLKLPPALCFRKRLGVCCSLMVFSDRFRRLSVCTDTALVLLSVFLGRYPRDLSRDEREIGSGKTRISHPQLETHTTTLFFR